MTVPPLMAARSAGIASSEVKKALTGDVYVRRWQSTRGKGKKKQLIDHELRINAVSGAAIAVGTGLTVLFGGMALWMMQLKVTGFRADKTTTRTVRIYNATGQGIVLNAMGVPIRRFMMTGETSITAQVLSAKEATNGSTATYERHVVGPEYEDDIFKVMLKGKVGISTEERAGFLG